MSKQTIFSTGASVSSSPTNQLHFLFRGSNKVLQQNWIVTKSFYTEWIDIPFEEE